MKRIYFVFVTPPLESYYHRYCIDYLEENGYETHILDTSPIVNPAAYEIVRTGVISEPKREIFYSRRAYKDYVKKAGAEAFFIIITDFYLDTLFLHTAIQRDQKYGYMYRIDTIVEADEETITNRWFDLLRNLSLHRLSNAVFTRLPRKLWHMKAADFVILGGMENRDLYIRLCVTDKHTKIKHIHSLDYDKYLQVRVDKERLIQEKYCVFIDQYLPYHPDGVGIGDVVDPVRYYAELEGLFTTIEKETGLKVVIATHPRGDYTLHNDVLNKYEKFRFKTAELIRDAEFVIAQFSTSICYATIFWKPILLVTGSDIKANKRMINGTKKYARLLHTQVCDISEPVNNVTSRLRIDEDAYCQFINDYLKPQDGNIDNRLFKIQLLELLESLNRISN